VIRGLRRTHRGVASLLALALPVALALALTSRNPLPAADPLPDALLGGAVPEGIQLTAGVLTTPGATLRHRLFSVDGTPAGLSVEVELTPPEAALDGLLYWVPAATGAANAGNALPDEAWLLGKLEAPWRPRFRLPPGADRGGFLLVYSLAKKSVVMRAAVERRATPGGGGP